MLKKIARWILRDEIEKLNRTATSAHEVALSYLSELERAEHAEKFANDRLVEATRLIEAIYKGTTNIRSGTAQKVNRMIREHRGQS